MINDTLSVRRAAIHRKTSSQPYWEATRERKLLLQYCPATGQYQFFPRPVSIATGRAELEWREVDGKGEIYSYSVTHRGPGPFVGQPPYAVVIVRLDVGADVIANLVGCEMPDVRIGLRVEPCWFPLEDGTHLLQFQPDEAAGTVTRSVNP
jgi:uncharacterized OB-fold protein